MDNRERDQVNRSDKPSDNEDVDQDVTSRRDSADSEAEFGEKIGQSEAPAQNTRKPDRSTMNH